MRLTLALDDLLELRHQARGLGIASRHPVNTALSGLYRSIFKGQGMDFEAVRAYQFGDEIRHMDWRVTARTGSAHMKVFHEERQRSLMLCVDVGASMQFGTRGTFKSIQAMRCVALLGWSALYNQDKIGGVIFGGEKIHMVRPQQGQRNLWRFLRKLSDSHEVSDKTPLVKILDRLNRIAPTGSPIVIVANFNQDIQPLVYGLGKLSQGHQLLLIPIDDPAEKNLAMMGKVQFMDNQGQRLDVNTSDARGQQAYFELWQQRRQRLIALSRRFAIALLPISTDDDVRQRLLAGLYQLTHK